MRILGNRFGLIYEDKDGKQHLYKSYSTLRGVEYAMVTDETFNKLKVGKVLIVELSDKDMKIEEDKGEV